ncbi:MAG: hypothetical protein QOC63_5955 [Mycobacterium sp.]|jgi:hypothetical protein|nr:hypothetical protein [Mycobacterium sp.]
MVAKGEPVATTRHRPTSRHVGDPPNPGGGPGVLNGFKHPGVLRPCNQTKFRPCVPATSKEARMHATGYRHHPPPDQHTKR